MDGLHRLGTESSSDEENLSAPNLSFDDSFCSWAPFKRFHLYTSVLLRAKSLAVLPVVVHTWLAVFRAVYRVPFTEFNLAEFVKFVDLPPNECVVVWIGVGGEECAAPIDPGTK